MPVPEGWIVGVWKTPATFRPYFINTASVISFKEWAGLCFGDKIAFKVCGKKFGFHPAFAQADYRSNPANVCFVENRSRVSAAVGALQAVELIENSFMCFLKNVMRREIPCETPKKNADGSTGFWRNIPPFLNQRFSEGSTQARTLCAISKKLPSVRGLDM